MTLPFSVQTPRIAHYSAAWKTKTHHLSLRIKNEQQQSFLKSIASFHQLFVVLISGLSLWLNPPKNTSHEVREDLCGGHILALDGESIYEENFC
jgi:hypothetical protein